LHGIVIESSRSRAFLEDPSVKRVAGYVVGDPVAGGTLQRITNDRVIIARPEGLIEVLLQDPTKPRPTLAAPSVAPVPAGAPPVLGQPGAPSQVGPAQEARGQAVLSPARMAPVPAADTTAHDQVLGQVMPPPVLSNQLAQGRSRAVGQGQQANE